jgi:hypothetical protein
VKGCVNSSALFQSEVCRVCIVYDIKRIERKNLRENKKVNHASLHIVTCNIFCDIMNSTKNCGKRERVVYAGRMLNL